MAGHSRIDELADHGRDDVRRLQVEVVARAVEIDGKHRDGGKPVLLPVRLGLHKKHLFGQTVGRIGFFRIAVPEILLSERNRRELGIGTDRPGGDKLADPRKPSPFHELGPHHQIFIEKTAGAQPIGLNSAHACRQVNDDIRTRVQEEPLHRIKLNQIILAAPGNENISGASQPEALDHMRSQKPGATGHDDSRMIPESHCA